VIDSNRGKFKVQVDEEGNTVLCTLSGKVKSNSIKIVVGDHVRIEVSPFEMTKGRIVFRIKSGS
jgi:translation initiation factor IF-1